MTHTFGKKYLFSLFVRVFYVLHKTFPIFLRKCNYFDDCVQQNWMLLSEWQSITVWQWRKITFLHIYSTKLLNAVSYSELYFTSVGKNCYMRLFSSKVDSGIGSVTIGSHHPLTTWNFKMLQHKIESFSAKRYGVTIRDHQWFRSSDLFIRFLGKLKELHPFWSTWYDRIVYV